MKKIIILTTTIFMLSGCELTKMESYVETIEGKVIEKNYNPTEVKRVKVPVTTKVKDKKTGKYKTVTEYEYKNKTEWEDWDITIEYVDDNITNTEEIDVSEEKYNSYEIGDIYIIEVTKFRKVAE